MKRLLSILLVAILSLTLVSVDDAAARRFGGGHSFGKQRLFQPHAQRYTRHAAPQRGYARSGLMTGLAGLAMGGLIGAMLFGGSFEGVNLLDILVLGGILALIALWLRRQPSVANRPRREAHASGGSIGAVRPNIDHAHFIQAAKEIYLRMQQAWDAGDLAEIRRFCTDEVAERIAAMMREGERHQTEVGTLHAEIADAWVEDDQEWVAVRFNAMMVERTRHNGKVDAEQGEVREIWIFRHDPNADDPTWYLAGIQQA